MEPADMTLKNCTLRRRCGAAVIHLNAGPPLCKRRRQDSAGRGFATTLAVICSVPVASAVVS